MHVVGLTGINLTGMDQVGMDQVGLTEKSQNQQVTTQKQVLAGMGVYLNQGCWMNLKGNFAGHSSHA